MRRAVKDDSILRRQLPTRVRIVIQSRPRIKNQKTGYVPIRGHILYADVQNLREFRRLWRRLETAVLVRAGWKDLERTPMAEGDDDGDETAVLPAAGVPYSDDL
jgi:hypothetical protein